ncbi:MAG: hypothetical protein OCD01_16625 [Fibrobacterales bacterium]
MIRTIYWVIAITLILLPLELFADQIIVSGGYSFYSPFNAEEDQAGNISQSIESQLEPSYLTDIHYVFYSLDRFTVNQFVYFGAGLQISAPFTLDPSINMDALFIPIYVSLNGESRKRAFVKPILRAKVGYNHLLNYGDVIDRGWGNLFASLSLEAKWLDIVSTGIDMSAKRFEYQTKATEEIKITNIHATVYSVSAYLSICINL